MLCKNERNQNCVVAAFVATVRCLSLLTRPVVVALGDLIAVVVVELACTLVLLRLRTNVRLRLLDLV